MLPSAFKQFESSFEKSYPIVEGREQITGIDVVVAIIVDITIADLVVVVTDVSVTVAASVVAGRLVEFT